jgi:hypothetical protein
VHDVDIESLSPELVLVDPELAAQLRPFVCATPKPLLEVLAERERRLVLAARPSAPVGPEAPAVPAPGESESVPGERWKRRYVRAGLHGSKVAIGALAVAFLLGAAFLPPRQAPHLETPASAAANRPTLVWRPNGNGYRVEIFAGRRLVHAVNTAASTYDVPSWLPPGHYTWRVFRDDWMSGGSVAPKPLEDGWFDLSRVDGASG